MPKRPPRTPAGEPRFDPPPDDTEGYPGEPEFESPPDIDAAAEAVEDYDPLQPFAVGDDLLQLKTELESLIFQRPAADALAAESTADEGPIPLIVGVGIGPAHRDFESVGPDGPGVPVLNVYVAEKLDVEQVKAILVDQYAANALSADDRRINVIESGIIDAQPHRHRQRAAPCGISCGHPKVTAGTLGVLARGRSGARATRLLVLSNNHVLANCNACAAGDPILQPGVADGGQDPADRIALLEQWVPLNFAGGVNVVDCATAWAWPDRVRRDFIYRAGTNWAYFNVTGAPVAPAIGMPVGKSGRTTQLTSGRIIDVNASIQVRYGAFGIANFRDQITVKGNAGDFSQGGDSGSLIWTWDSRRAPVTLLFAGGNGLTFGNKLGAVLSALDINLYI